MARIKATFLAWLCCVAVRAVAAGHVAGESSGAGSSAFVYGDLPLWDIANEGLPFRLTLAVPSRRDPVARILLAEETRWSVGVGYAKVYNSWDATTGVFKNHGGHAALVSAGRQYWWGLPDAADRPYLPRLMIEFGVQYATRPFPADGTRANLKLITGLEWEIPKRGWSVGIMWPHFSNAGLFDKNAGYDGLSLRVGRAVRW